MAPSKLGHTIGTAKVRADGNNLYFVGLKAIWMHPAVKALDRSLSVDRLADENLVFEIFKIRYWAKLEAFRYFLNKVIALLVLYQ